MELLQQAIQTGSDPEGLQRLLEDRVLGPDAKHPPGLLRNILEAEGPIQKPVQNPQEQPTVYHTASAEEVERQSRINSLPKRLRKNVAPFRPEVNQ